MIWQQRVRDRIAADSRWSRVIKEWGMGQGLDDAGFFDDGARHPVTTNDTTWLGTPTDKLAKPALSPTAQNAVLVTTGAFSPFHEGHLHMVDVAKRGLEDRGWTVLGGYVSLSHDDYVATKHNGAAACPTARRGAVAEEALYESEWLMVDYWEATREYSINFTDVVDHVQFVVDRAFPSAAVAVWYVCGGDNVKFLRAFAGDNRAICVTRPGHAPLDEGYGLVLEGSVEQSSTNIRRARLQKDKRPILSSYAVRDDLDFGSKELAADEADLCVFKENLLAALATALGPTVPLHVLRTDDQKDALVKLQTPTLSLDPVLATTHNLEISRYFKIAGAQTVADHYGPRPGSLDLTTQLKQLPPGSYTLVDDDIATGGTTRYVKDLLRPPRRITACWSALSALGHTAVGDVVDARDFLLGAHAGGLVVELPNGDVCRAPYLWPYVALDTRASLPVDVKIKFSAELWRANATLFEKNALTVNDTEKAHQTLFFALGYTTNAPLATIAYDHAAMCVRLL